MTVHGLSAEDTQLGASLLVMAIIGGAVWTPVMGLASDVVSINSAFAVPALCFLVVAVFAVAERPGRAGGTKNGGGASGGGPRSGGGVSESTVAGVAKLLDPNGIGDGVGMMELSSCGGTGTGTGGGGAMAAAASATQASQP